MAFDWLTPFQQKMEKSAQYAEKTLASYRLGMKSNGSIIGVRVVQGPQACSACHALEETAVYHPDKAPRLPLPQCDRAQHCGCIYRPVMSYESMPHGGDEG